MCEVAAVSQLTELALPELFAECRLVERVLRDDLLLPAAPELLLAVSEGALVPVAAGSRIRPVLTHNCLDVGPLNPASTHPRPAEAPVDVGSELSIVCCQMQEFAIVPKVTVTLKHYNC